MAGILTSVVTGAGRDYLHNVLNEVLHGFDVDLRARLYSEYSQVLALLNELDGADERYEITSENAVVLIRASDLCEEEFEDSEFGTRLGFSKQQAHEVVFQLEQITGGMSHTKLVSPFESRILNIKTALHTKAEKAY